MAEYFTQNLINLSGIIFAPDSVSKLALNHAENCLHIRAAMVVRQEILTIEHEPMVHLRPVGVVVDWEGIDLEGNKRRRTQACSHVYIGMAKVCFVSTDFCHSEMLCRGRQQGFVIGSVVGGPPTNVYSGYDVRPGSTNEMGLYPLSVVYVPSILFVEPLYKAAGAKPTRVNGKLAFDGLQWKAADCYQVSQDLGQVWVS